MVTMMTHAFTRANRPGSDDQVYFLGDLIDRGPQSASGCRFVQSSSTTVCSKSRAVLLEVLDGGRFLAKWSRLGFYSGGYADHVIEATIPQKHLDWMRGSCRRMDLGDV